MLLWKYSIWPSRRLSTYWCNLGIPSTDRHNHKYLDFGHSCKSRDHYNGCLHCIQILERNKYCNWHSTSILSLGPLLYYVRVDVTWTIKFCVPAWITVTCFIVTDAFVIAIHIAWTVKHYKNNTAYYKLFFFQDFSHIWSCYSAVV